MNEVPWTFRKLFREIETIAQDPAWNLDYRRSDLLSTWIDGNRETLAYWRAFAVRPGASAATPIPTASSDELTELYALSRILDKFISSEFSHDRFRQLGDALGGTQVEEADFHPFHHEIVSVEQASDADQPIVITDWTWPCTMLGNMLLCRGGVKVIGGINVIDGTIAASSTLYWASTRGKHGRRCCDPSHGWGGNSQWATDFRRDYRIGGRCHYNVDGELDLAADTASWPRALSQDGLTVAERLEVLRHRCFIVSKRRSDDLWPFKFRWVEDDVH